MPRWSTRSVLVLLAALQLLLQPLAATPMCWLASSVGTDDCCRPAEANEVEARDAPSSDCCSAADPMPAAPWDESAPELQAAGEDMDCRCEAAPDPAPATPPRVHEISSFEFGTATMVNPSIQLAAPCESPLPTGPPGTRPPGVGRAVHLLNQVFRL